MVGTTLLLLFLGASGLEPRQAQISVSPHHKPLRCEQLHIVTLSGRSAGEAAAARGCTGLYTRVRNASVVLPEFAGRGPVFSGTLSGRCGSGGARGERTYIFYSHRMGKWIMESTRTSVPPLITSHGVPWKTPDLWTVLDTQHAGTYAGLLHSTYCMCTGKRKPSR
jgi:hypothetical protein